MDKNQLLSVEQNLNIKQQELAQMQMLVEQQKTELDSQTAQELSQRLGNLYKEYATLKQKIAVLYSNEAVYEQLQQANTPQVVTTQQTIPSPVVKPAIQTAQNAQPQAQQNSQNAQAHIQQRRPASFKPAKPKRDLEKALGKNVMGVMASVLIFVALILFAIVALPSMTDTIKMAAMFIISGGITGIGVMLMRKDQSNAFNASIAGCGIGAVFISLMTTRMYFNAINDYVLYITLLIWAAAVAFFSKDKNKVFVVIAEVGISVATLIGLAGLFGEDAAAGLKANMLIAFALLSEIAIYYFNSTDEMDNDIFMHFPHAIRAFAMTIMFIILADTNSLENVPIMMVAFIGIGLYLLSRTDGDKGKDLILTTYVLPITLAFNNYAIALCNGAENVEPYIILIGIAIIFHLFTYFYNKYKVAVGASHIAIIACAIYFMSEVSSADSLEVMTILVPAALVLMPIMLMTNYCKENYWKWLSAGLPLFFVVLWNDIGGLTQGQILVGFVIALIYTLANFHILDDIKDDILRICLYIASMITFPLIFGDIIDCLNVEGLVAEAIIENIYVTCAYVPLVLVYLWVDKKDCITREKDITVLQNIIMGILILVGSISLHEGAYLWLYKEDPIAYRAAETAWTVSSWVVGLTLIGLNALRTVPMLNKGKGYGIGVSAAYVVSLWSIITRISDVNYIVSITMLLLAIGMIVMGFKINLDEGVGNKEMRLFGLVLSMVVTVKLLMLDIEHNNLLETSGYLLLAGVLCFAISFAYNRLDKVMVREQLEASDEEPEVVDTLENS